jgi:hypothetical protein
MQRIFIHKCFLFTVGSVCSVKQFSLGGKLLADDRDIETKAWKQLKQCVFFFSRFEYNTFYISYPSATYLLTLPCISTVNLDLQHINMALNNL